MLIPVTFNPSSTSTTACPSSPLPSTLAQISHSEIVLVELQGSLEVNNLGTTTTTTGGGAGGVESKDGKFVGKLTVDETAKPTLRIGHHLLEGNIVSLAKPLAVLVRRRRHRRRAESGTPPPRPTSQGHGDGGSMDVDVDEGVDDDGNGGGNGKVITETGVNVNDDEATSRPVSISRGREDQVCWEAIAVVKRKIIFPKRPMPIVGRPILSGDDK